MVFCGKDSVDSLCFCDLIQDLMEERFSAIYFLWLKQLRFKDMNYFASFSLFL